MYHDHRMGGGTDGQPPAQGGGPEIASLQWKPIDFQKKFVDFHNKIWDSLQNSIEILLFSIEIL